MSIRHGFLEDDSGLKQLSNRLVGRTPLWHGCFGPVLTFGGNSDLWESLGGTGSAQAAPHREKGLWRPENCSGLGCILCWAEDRGPGAPGD